MVSRICFGLLQSSRGETDVTRKCNRKLARSSQRPDRRSEPDSRRQILFSTDTGHAVSETATEHLVESQKFLVGEACRPDTNLMRGSFADNVKQYAPNVRDVDEKDELLNLLRASMDEAASQLTSAADEMKNPMKRFDGKEMPKLAFMSL